LRSHCRADTRAPHSLSTRVLYSIVILHIGPVKLGWFTFLGSQLTDLVGSVLEGFVYTFTYTIIMHVVTRRNPALWRCDRSQALARSGPAAVHATALWRLRYCSVAARLALSESGPSRLRRRGLALK